MRRTRRHQDAQAAAYAAEDMHMAKLSTDLEPSTPEQVVACAMRAELRLILSLAGLLAKSDSPVTDAGDIVDDLGDIAIQALIDAGYTVGKPPPA